MLEFFDFIKFLFWIVLLLFIPGGGLFLAICYKNTKKISSWEALVISLGLSLFIIDFFLIGLGILGIKITALSSLLVIFAISLACFSIFFLKKELLLIKKKISLTKALAEKKQPEKKVSSAGKTIFPLPTFFKVAFILAAVLVFLPRLLYVKEGVAPTATDLGHHMYWSKYISLNGKLPDYSEAVIEKADLGKFIIGEHLLFSLFNLTSKETFWGAMPPLILLVFNLFSILAVAFLAINLFLIIFPKTKPLQLRILFLIFIFVFGVFWPISAPQVKYVTGGVVGNVLGNFLIPLTFLLLALAVRLQESLFALLAVLVAFLLAYTHHLSAFVFIYSFLGALFLFFFGIVLQSFWQKKGLASSFKKAFSFVSFYLTPLLLGIIFVLILFLFLYPPSYLDFSVIQTAVGSPSKETRTGLELTTIIDKIGSWNFLFSFFGLGLLLWRISQENLSKKDNLLARLFSLSIILGWFGIIFLGSYRPDWLKINILSTRVVTYLIFPASLLSGFFVFWFLNQLRKTTKNSFLFGAFFLLIFSSGLFAGTTEITEIEKDLSSPSHRQKIYSAWQTFEAAEFLAQRTTSQETILKDHIYLTGDSWMKLVFMRGYKYPLSRSYLHRYEKERETCTRDMISLPDTEIGATCFNETKTSYIVLKRGRDDAALLASPNFYRVFSSDDVVIFKRNEK